MNNQDVPILILVFNRPDKVKTLIESLSAVKPSVIYIAADGPRPGIDSDVENCALSREVALDITWPCEIKTRFSETNFGCRYGITNAIDWFFENEEYGIILEDDCIPNPSFFSFCTKLLRHYKDESHIKHISGNNFQDGIVRGEGSYYFSLYTHSWGWATWRRAWREYKPALENFADFDKNKEIDKLPLSKQARNFWLKNFRQTIKGNDSWDSLWLYTVWKNNGLSIIPNKNLVSNIGFGEDATHTNTNTKQANLKTETISQVIHPKEIIVDQNADIYTFKRVFYTSLAKRLYLKMHDIFKS